LVVGKIVLCLTCTGVVAKIKEKADSVGQKIQAKVETAGFTPQGGQQQGLSGARPTPLNPSRHPHSQSPKHQVTSYGSRYRSDML